MSKIILFIEVGTITSALLEPLKNPIAVASSYNDRSNYPDVLNRHEILHGIDYEYGNEINSLKVISILNYISSILYKAKQQIK